jgi:hypothetical protein
LRVRVRPRVVLFSYLRVCVSRVRALRACARVCACACARACARACSRVCACARARAPRYLRPLVFPPRNRSRVRSTAAPCASASAYPPAGARFQRSAAASMQRQDSQPVSKLANQPKSANQPVADHPICGVVILLKITILRFVLVGGQPTSQLSSTLPQPWRVSLS